MAAKQQLKYGADLILRHAKEGSFGTQDNRKITIHAFIELLYTKTPYKLKNIRNISEKHIRAVFDHWRLVEKHSPRTLKNYAAHMRWLCKKLDRANVMPTNKSLKIPKCSYLPTYNKAIKHIDLHVIHDPYIRDSLEGQRLFGFRREESMKIRPHVADKGHFILLIGSWCKGGKPRAVPILTKEQRDYVNYLKDKYGKNASLIPKYKSYKDHIDTYKSELERVRLHNMHGLRHAYCQRRFKELTGFDCPFDGGPTKKELTPEQQELDKFARYIIAEEMGHSREYITKSYLF